MTCVPEARLFGDAQEQLHAPHLVDVEIAQGFSVSCALPKSLPTMPQKRLQISLTSISVVTHVDLLDCRWLAALDDFRNYLITAA